MRNVNYLLHIKMLLLKSTRVGLSNSSILLKVIIFLLLRVSSLISGAAHLPNDEVQALKDIGNALGKKWDFSVDPCGQQNGWFTSKANNAVLCKCSFDGNTTCHVVSIVLRRQSLSGTLSKDLVQLPYLQTFDVVRNYVNGTIPLEWGSMPNLKKIALSNNRLTGSIPKEFGNISTLATLSLEGNQLSGVLPSELGNLTKLQVVWLNSNNFTGNLPTTFAKLASLRRMFLNDNQFTGNIPDFIENWTNIEKLAIQGSGLQGPIPSSIAALKKLNDLRISDLNGTKATFPEFGNLNMSTLILRSCNLIGELPDYIGKMTNLLTLDVSFNNLTGELPSSLENLATKGYKYLTGNLFSGPVPNWILNKGENLDISYNNFTTKSSRCQERSVNMFASSSKGNHPIISCLKSLQCPKSISSLYINCGGKEAKIGKTTYNEDTDAASPTRFFQSGYNWAYSNTGHFMDDSLRTDNYIWSNKSRLSIENLELYMNARLSPLSLTYYGYCLMNGNYTISLHFAEIVFTNDHNYTSLGRRIFDVYVQDKLVLKDFNIAKEARGVGKLIVKNFTIPIISGTLEIRLYWAGKGTIAIPKRGFYGPLISAISVNPDFVLTKKSNGMQISSYAIVGIVAGVALVILLILGAYYGRGCLRQKHTLQDDIKHMDIQTSAFTLKQIKEATNNFHDSNKIGEGGFGPVYKGVLSDGTPVAVKQLSYESKQGNREFLNEIGMVTTLQNPHLVKIYGCCIEGNELLLVYEYMEKNSLAHALFGPKEFLLKLDWSTRQKICLGIARGLAFLHEESTLKIVHRDIKTTNVLLDKNLNPKISDFGLAKLDDGDNTHMSTRISGTCGYMAPEYALHGYLTNKADVYSFGVVALEIVSGRRSSTYQQKECFMLLAWAQELQEKGNLLELVDPRLGSAFKRREVMRMINVALLCTNLCPASRPAMSLVVRMLEGKIAIPSFVPIVSATNDKTVRTHMEHNEKVMGNENITASMSSSGWTTENMTQSTRTNGPRIPSPISGNDLYPLTLDTDYQRPSNGECVESTMINFH